MKPTTSRHGGRLKTASLIPSESCLTVPSLLRIWWLQGATGNPNRLGGRVLLLFLRCFLVCQVVFFGKKRVYRWFWGGFDVFYQASVFDARTGGSRLLKMSFHSQQNVLGKQVIACVLSHSDRSTYEYCAWAISIFSRFFWWFNEDCPRNYEERCQLALIKWIGAALEGGLGGCQPWLSST